MNTVLTHPDGSVRVEERDGKRAISVEPRDGIFSPRIQWITDYPLDLIEHILRVKGPAYLCDEISRDENPLSVAHHFHWDILSYSSSEDFAGRRVLDFGSGSGASTMALARMFPEAEIVGVELVSELMEVARHRAAYYGLEDRVRFLISPDSESLPPEIGVFDCIVLSAVYEHLLPGERRVILARLWEHLRPGGILFLDQTPNRWFPVEDHTTGLLFINYLPDRVALFCSRRFSRRVHRTASWEELLRDGVRGASAGEILAILNRDGREAELLSPSRLGVRDRIDLWYHRSTNSRKSPAKKLVMWSFRAFESVTGVSMIPWLSLAIRRAD